MGFEEIKLKEIKLNGFPLLSLMQAIWKARPDLQEIFLCPDGERIADENFLKWFIENAPNEFNFDESVLEEVLKIYGKKVKRQKVKTFSTKSKKIFNKKEKNELGVNLCAFIKGDFGIGEGGRRTAASLAEANTEFGIIDLYDARYVAHKNSNDTWNEKLLDKPKYDINVFHCNPDQLDATLKTEYLKDRYNIGYWVWELPHFPDKWVEWFKYFDEIWTPSYYSAESMCQKTNIPIIRVPHSIEVKVNKEMGRNYFGLPSNKFLFLFMYDVLSWIDRKNPQAVIEAFKKAFKNNEDVGLVIKVSNSKHGPEDIKKLEELKKNYKNIYIIDEILPKIEINSLLNCCDVFVSLHRAEGFGLGLAEAMYLGKPVIGTGWSGNTDFMKFDNSCLVKYKLKSVNVNYAGATAENQYWAEADVDDAAKYMYKLYTDKAYYDEIARRGKETILNDFSAKAVGKIIQKRIEQIRK